MGYSVDISLSGVRILARNVPGAIRAMLRLMGEEVDETSDPSLSPPFEEGEDIDQEGDSMKATPSFSWVDVQEAAQAARQGNLVKLLEEWRYSAYTCPVSDMEKLANLSEHGDVHIEDFCGEKWGDDDTLWSVLSPYIEDGAIVQMHGEDDAHWRYVFNGGAFVEQFGHIEWT